MRGLVWAWQAERVKKQALFGASALGTGKPFYMRIEGG
jgi:hypothetical protein